jgi:hypothetical protein
VGWIDKLIASIRRLNIVQGARNIISRGLGFGGGRAAGGFVQGGMSYLVGEQGPELFLPGRSGYIVPNQKLGGKNININIFIKGNTIMDKRAAEKIGDLMIKKLKTSNLLG